MRYLVILILVVLVIILGLALYGWYRHLRDDED